MTAFQVWKKLGTELCEMFVKALLLLPLASLGVDRFGLACTAYLNTLELGQVAIILGK